MAVRVDGVRVEGAYRSAPPTGQRAVRINLLAPIQALAAVGPRLLSAAGRRGLRGPAQSGHTKFVIPKSFKHSRSTGRVLGAHLRRTPATPTRTPSGGRFSAPQTGPKSAAQDLGSERPQRRVETASARVRSAPAKSTRGEGPPRTGFSGEPRAVPKRKDQKKAARAALRASFWEAARKRGARRPSAAH